MPEDNFATDVIPSRPSSSMQRLLEFYLWIFLSLVVSGRFWLMGLPYLARSSDSAQAFTEIAKDLYFDILGGLLILIFPIVYKLIFGAFPLELMRIKRLVRTKVYIHEAPATTELHERVNVENVPEAERTTTETVNLPVKTDSAIEFLNELAFSSRLLATTIFTRAGVYLLVGVLVAFSGLIFFYLQTSSTLIKADNLTTHILQIAPRFGVLFFIELIAFFFLKQYRSAMDEFRYFEAIKRNREETLALIRLLKELDKPLDPLELIKQNCFYSQAGKLSKGETTEILETRKLDKDQTELLGKVVDAVAKASK